MNPHGVSEYAGDDTYLELWECLTILPYSKALEWADWLKEQAPRRLSEKEAAIVIPVVGSLALTHAMEIAGAATTNIKTTAFKKMFEGLDDETWQQLRDQTENARRGLIEFSELLQAVSPGRQALFTIELLNLAQPFEPNWHMAVEHVVVGQNSLTSFGKYETTAARVKRGLLELARYATPAMRDEIESVLAQEKRANQYGPDEFRAVLKYMEPEERIAAVQQAMEAAQGYDLLLPIHEALLTERFINDLPQGEASQQLKGKFTYAELRSQEGPAIKAILPYLNERFFARLQLNQAPLADRRPTTDWLKTQLPLLPPKICRRLIESLCSRSQAVSQRHCNLLKLLYADHQPQEEVMVQLGLPKKTTFYKERNIAVASLVVAFNITDQAVIDTFINASAELGDEYYFNTALAAATGLTSSFTVASEVLEPTVALEETTPEVSQPDPPPEPPESPPQIDRASSVSNQELPAPAQVQKLELWGVTIMVGSTQAGLYHQDRREELPRYGPEILAGLVQRGGEWTVENAMKTLNISLNEVRQIVYGLQRKLAKTHTPGTIEMVDGNLILKSQANRTVSGSQAYKGDTGTRNDVVTEQKDKIKKMRRRSGSGNRTLPSDSAHKNL